ncbi:MAG TPA: DUF4010 domain-containing protein [Alphaproteobacteria bacterium]|nr:DUF4010 domain-containing protein [Alphaproteobacteria bacterium]
MDGNLQVTPERLLILLGLAFFFGLAFEEFYGADPEKPPGGVRTFPLLALAGGLLFFLEPHYALPFVAGLAALGIWLLAYYKSRVRPDLEPARRDAGLMVPVCNLLAYLGGPIVLWGPIWLGVAFAVAAVLLLGARAPLHALARRLPQDELSAAGKFLILTGIVLPLLPNKPVTTLTSITPYQVWLAVIAVSTISYASYLVQRYVAPRAGGLLASVLGGLYSSTATTVVLGRELRQAPERTALLQSGIVLATAIMYLRIAAVVAVFNLALALELLPWLLGLAAFSALLAGACYARHRGAAPASGATAAPANPLAIGTALLFAALFVAISLVSSWVQGRFGFAGLYWLAAIVGVTDIDPFVLSVAQGAAHDAALASQAATILIAASSNNALKAAYAVAFGRWRGGAVPAAALVLVGIAGIGLALWLTR